tara:strand:- start:207 stop:884 length:678 start_codon:yes stop_codon:yes gene_type:complete
MLVTSAEATQAISDLIVGRTYVILIQTSGSTLTLEVGTSSGGSQTTSSTLTIASGNEVLFSEITFVATSTVHYVSFTESAGEPAYIKIVQLMENVTPASLKYISFEEYSEKYRERDSRPDTDKFAEPEYIYTNYNDEIGLTPIPDTSNRTIAFDYYTVNVDLSLHGDTSVIPTRFESVINARAKYYTYMFRSDVQTAQYALKEYEDGVKRMRIELINRKNYMRAV